MPTPAPEAARRHYLIQKALTAAIVAKLLGVWHRVDIGNLDKSWNALTAQATTLLTNGQVLAASRADNYLTAVLAEQGIDTARDATIAASAFAGTASDGRNLETLLAEPVITTKVAIAAQRTPSEALGIGEAAFARIVATQIQDAGRTSVAVGIAARPQVTSWTRMVNAPACSRCIILAGKVYRWNASFDRHPHCDCTAVPSNEDVDGDFTTDPDLYFRQLSVVDQDRYFTKAGAETIRRGGDMNQVVNARMGMYRSDGKAFTTSGTTKRGTAGKSLRGERRLMPETIIDQSNGDRARAVELLQQHGFLV